MPEFQNRAANERRLEAAILLLFRDDPEAYLRDDFEQKLRDALIGELGATFLEAYVGLAEEIGVDYSLEKATQRAEKWAARYAKRLSRELAESMRSRFEDPPEDFDLMAAILLSAGLISATEVTRSITTGERDLAKYVKRTGQGEIIGYWMTERRRVCPVCSALDGQPERVWRRRFPGGPPDPHPGCRCWIRWVFRPYVEAI